MATVKKTKKVMKKDSNGGKLGQFTVEVAKTKDTAATSQELIVQV